MKYKFTTEVKKNDVLRASFNKLTRQVYCFDFINWYKAGHWGNLYIPHVLLDGDRVISNVSVNLMQFDIRGVKKNYIQLGTVMTDCAYRGQGLNREIIERILNEYAGKVDGIYLFGNDSVIDYYPKFGFQPSKEYEYYIQCENQMNLDSYLIEKVDMTRPEESERLYDVIRAYSKNANILNQNDAMCMSDNLGLYQFWLAAEYANQIFHLPEIGIYVVAEQMGDVLQIYQVFGKQEVDMMRLAKAFDDHIKEVVLGYSPVHKEQFLVREHKEEDCTLFILGEDLQRIERDKMRFPVLSHA